VFLLVYNNFEWKMKGHKYTTIAEVLGGRLHRDEDGIRLHSTN